ncbi:MAG TPA: carboxypeptidase regulatory-like domain-containing protein [Blastocatellia bacterium]|nr:carboxypeptidase regulatory-like domain-containing protein [Blastocatellia bacterium]HMV87388.1 carboxypeptidase regulatory-like domain-containing protein [Blastocatellia bacterium]HMX27247.1 carboxypeptidase regulatory-like domain-containing protein [Blastocatellia bacterium]HMY71135.1 carboxypeptidase regulatory-like domain-containing protein [Blastocatellia bacterium]HMZ19601.1 carboxypeptidase regulatory-like domain-containing protein [Blastocatellia bacterium]
MDSVLRKIFPGALLLASVVGLVGVSFAQTTKATAVIAGRIIIGDGGAPGVEVIAVKQETGGGIVFSGQPTQTYNATTDTDGNYRITNVPAGSFRVTAYAPAHVTPGERNSFGPANSGKTVNLAEGETAENVNFSLIRGGVISGKLTDEDGRIVIEESVYTYKLDQNGKRAPNTGPVFSEWRTDDRGVYRIYGLEPGRYLVSAGASSEEASIRIGSGGGFYRRTFHPEAAEEADAKIIEVRSGGEAENVDIRLARAAKGYVATGRVIDGDTGKPIFGAMIGYGIVKDRGSSFGMGNSATNSLGEFRLEGLTPNTYTAYARLMTADNENYSESVKFEVLGGDVSGLEIKMKRGAVISGLATVEGVRDPAVLANLSKIYISAQNLSNEPMVGINGGNINANGTFKLGGLRPGKTRINAQLMGTVKGFSLLRVEHNGQILKEFELNAGDQLTGVTLVFAYGTGSIFGRVEVKGGTLPPGSRMSVTARREGEETTGISSIRPVTVDARGQFLIEGLSAGNYKLVLIAYPQDFQPGYKPPRAEQNVSVAGDGRQEASMVLDLSAQPKENDK